MKESLLDFGDNENIIIRKIYIFGSIICSSKPKDVDILVIYDGYKNDILNGVLGFKDLLKYSIKINLGKEADIILLNLEEYSESTYTSIRKILLYESK